MVADKLRYEEKKIKIYFGIESKYKNNLLKMTSNVFADVFRKEENVLIVLSTLKGYGRQ